MPVLITSTGDVSIAVAELQAAADGLRSVPLTIVEQGSAAARTAILDTVRQARGTLSMSGLGANLDVAVQVSSSEGSAEASLRPTPAGSWAIVDKGAKQHTQRRRRGMPTPYGIYSKVNHPGVAGRHIAGPARRAADNATAEAARTAMDQLPRH